MAYYYRHKGTTDINSGKESIKTGIVLFIMSPFLLLALPFELAGFTLSNLFGPFADVSEVWFDYFSNMIM